MYDCGKFKKCYRVQTQSPWKYLYPNAWLIKNPKRKITTSDLTRISYSLYHINIPCESFTMSSLVSLFSISHLIRCFSVDVHVHLLHEVATGTSGRLARVDWTLWVEVIIRCESSLQKSSTTSWSHNLLHKISKLLQPPSNLRNSKKYLTRNYPFYFGVVLWMSIRRQLPLIMRTQLWKT